MSSTPPPTSPPIASSTTPMDKDSSSSDRKPSSSDQPPPHPLRMHPLPSPSRSPPPPEGYAPSFLDIDELLEFMNPQATAILLNSDGVKPAFEEYVSAYLHFYLLSPLDPVPAIDIASAVSMLLVDDEREDPFVGRSQPAPVIHAARFAFKVVQYLESDNCEQVAWHPRGTLDDAPVPSEIKSERYFIALAILA